MKDINKKNVAIVAGTHGNEWTGVYLVDYWLNNPKLIYRKNLNIVPILANKKAFMLSKRYVDVDLNRCCSKSVLTHEPVLHEELLAHYLSNKLKFMNFVVDLHTTTSNMGISLVISNMSKLTWQVASYLKTEFPNLKIYKWNGDKEGGFVNSLAINGFAIEIGPIPQGVLRADIYLQTQDVINKLIDYLENPKDVKKTLTIYDHVDLVDFPRDGKGNIIAMVHPNRQDKDFSLINRGDEMFLTFDGKTITYERAEPLYGLFINEAAYYEKNFALTLARKIEYTY